MIRIDFASRNLFQETSLHFISLPSKSTLRRYWRSVIPLVGFIASHNPGFPWQRSRCISLGKGRIALLSQHFLENIFGDNICR